MGLDHPIGLDPLLEGCSAAKGKEFGSSALLRDGVMCGVRYLEQLPPTLFVTELLARSAVQMSKHYIVQCRLGFLTDRQLTKLQVIHNILKISFLQRASQNRV